MCAIDWRTGKSTTRKQELHKYKVLMIIYAVSNNWYSMARCGYTQTASPRSATVCLPQYKTMMSAI